MNNIPNNPNIEVIKAKETGLFTNYIFKAIPLAFDESMSYYETLCGLLNYLKNVVIPTLNNNADAVSELQTLYEELKSYVDNYFTNLDVQEEINNKLDKMTQDGSLSKIIRAYVQPIINQQNEAIKQINDKVNNMINFTPSVASNMSDMTDTSKVYILTTDGHWYYYNGTSWVSGGLYQGITVPNDSITPIKIKGHTILNLLNFKDIDTLTNYGIAQVSATSVEYAQTSATLSVSGYIPVEPGQIIYSTCKMPSNYQAIVYFDSNKNVIGMEKVATMWVALGEKTIPNNCYYIRIGYNYASSSPNAIYTTDASNLPEAFIPYGKFTINGLYVEQLSDIVTITVKKDGTGDYDNLRDALESTNTKDKYIINVYPGIYDVLSDYTSAEINNAYYVSNNIRGSFCGPYIDGNITLRGIGSRDEIVILGRLDSTYGNTIREQISTLNLQGNVTIENMTIIAENLRYAIHDDFISNFTTTNIKNCIIKSERPNGYGIAEYSHAYGMGTKSGKITNIENCVMAPRFYLHTNKNFTEASITNLRDSYFLENIFIADMNSGKKDLINIENCVSDFIRFDYYPGNSAGTCELYCNTSIPVIHNVNDYYITADIMEFRNQSANTILKGSLIQKKSTSFEITNTATNFEVMTGDDPTLFYGICLDDVEQFYYGRVQTHGYIKASDIGLNATIGSKYKIKNGSLVPTTDNDYIAICNMQDYIYIY